MQNSNIIIAIVVLVAVGGGLWYYNETTTSQSATSDTHTQTLSTDDTDDDSIEKVDLNGNGSLMQLLSLGRSLRCEYSYVEDNLSYQGTMYTDAGVYRVDVSWSDGVTDSTMHIFSDNENVYMWNDGEPEQFAYVVHAHEHEHEGEETYTMEDYRSTSGYEAASLEANVDYDCQPWRVDFNLLYPPAGMSFRSLEDMQQEMMQNIQLPEGVEMPEGFPGQQY